MSKMIPKFVKLHPDAVLPTLPDLLDEIERLRGYMTVILEHVQSDEHDGNIRKPVEESGDSASRKLPCGMTTGGCARIAIEALEGR